MKFMVHLLTLCLMTFSYVEARAQAQTYGVSPGGTSGVWRGDYGEGAFNENAYLIGPNNLLHIRILNEGGVQQTFRVDDFGFITHPLIGRVKLAGLTVAQAEERIKSVLDGDYIINPQVTIFVLEHSRYSILGEVRNPGNYEIIGRMTIVEAISKAGGFTPVANEKRVRLIRRNEDTEEMIMVVNVQDIIDGKREDNFYIEAGDVINVPKSFF